MESNQNRSISINEVKPYQPHSSISTVHLKIIKRQSALVTMSSNFKPKPDPVSSSSPIQNFEEMYSAIGGTYEKAFAQDEGLLKFLERVVEILPTNSQILDLGCGTGRPVASTLSSAGHQIYGLDFSQTMISLSQTSVPNGKFAMGDMRTFDPLEHWSSDLKKIDGSFDAIFTILSLFALSRSEIEALGSKWRDWVKVGGFICICTIAAEDLQPRDGEQKGDGEGKGYDEDGFGCRGIEGRFMGNVVTFSLFTREGWRWLLKENGFEIVEEWNNVYQPPKEADSEDEPHLFLLARRV
ncbi:87b8289b-71aa-4041-b9bd-50d2291918e2 [Sclerotinia trifoliorum]|uniref:phosphoethanolamine N-methyltransferase n=1 Tax=Sclerotinia trifoliorum TaxID=28548 RepID=A0A8H2VU17_9HELO|nr:87b8289b-71aa-4041-b9bd-50d2291918e2 [Sclerotinia trifoliorum]